MKDKLLILTIFVFGLGTRLFFFNQSVYFGIDEARDAYVSQAIYQKGDLKLVGPTTNGAAGLNHGVLHWYVTGLLYLIGHGSPFFVSLVFRIFNALGIFLIYGLAKKLFNSQVGTISALLYAFSFEQSQYALYMGNPSLAVISALLIMCGFAVLLKDKHPFWALPLMALGLGSGIQFELSFVGMAGLATGLLFLARKRLITVSRISWVVTALTLFLMLGSFLAAEVKYNFRQTKAGLEFLSAPRPSQSDPGYVVYTKRFITMASDNFVFPVLFAVALIATCIKFRRAPAYLGILLWSFSGVFTLGLVAYQAYYINVGIGPALLVIMALFLHRKRMLALFLLTIMIIGNVQHILAANPKGLIMDIKTQTGMLLSDELEVIRRMYATASGRPFTVRATSMPYRVQTVWAYIFTRYGKYLPYWETGNVLDFPGQLPPPVSGSTCLRFLLREPTNGIPVPLVTADENEENFFSDIIDTWQVGDFVVQHRQAKGHDCRNSFITN